MLEEFRRTEEERRQRVNSGPREVDAGSEDGLPYDRDDAETSKTKRALSGKRRGLVLATVTGSDTDDEKKHSPPPVYASRVDLGRHAETSEPSEMMDSRADTTLNQAEASDLAENDPLSIKAEAAPNNVAEHPRWSEQELEEIRQMEKRRVLEEKAQQEEERLRLGREEAERRATQIREEEERRLEQEAQERRAIQQREEEERREEAERTEAKHRAQEQEVEKARLAEEAVRARKDNLRAELHRGKATGGMMLQGVSTLADIAHIQHVTVQTTKSVTWRRRHFQLFPTELKLFKTDTVSSLSVELM